MGAACKTVLMNSSRIGTKTSWHHAPLHIFQPGSIYMITGGTLGRRHLFRGRERLRLLESVFFDVITCRDWELRAWALFSNHYHFVGRAPEKDGDIGLLMKHFHSEASKELNRMDAIAGRKVMYQYWDKCLTFEKSYYARRNYVMHNPVRHGLVSVAEDYPFCSAGWFRNNFQNAFRSKVGSFKHDRLNEKDDFEPVWDESA